MLFYMTWLHVRPVSPFDKILKLKVTPEKHAMWRRCLQGADPPLSKVRWKWHTFINRHRWEIHRH